MLQMLRLRHTLSFNRFSPKLLLFGFVLVFLLSSAVFILYKEDLAGKNSAHAHTLVNTPDMLALLDVELPDGWQLDKREKAVFYLLNEKGERRGSVGAYQFKENFDLLTQMPNHSTVVYDEWIEIPLGKTRFITLDADNGPAASGAVGTHDVYYASIAIEGKATYILDFTEYDENPETRTRFIEILNRLRLDN
jgi:hypothetical protein